MKQKQKIEKKYIWLGAILIISLLIAFLVYIVTTDRKLSVIESTIKDGTLFVANIAWTPIRFMQTKLRAIEDHEELYQKYVSLQERVDTIERLEAKNQELQKEIQELKQQLDLQATLSEEQVLNATVIERNVGFWYHTLTLDKGSKNGVEENMAVVTSHGLIGKVIKVSNFTSTVKLITSEDVNNKISVKIQVGESFVYGLLTGYDQKKKVYRVEGISENVTIEPGAMVTTTGLGEMFSSGILVGKVSGVTTDQFDLGMMVEVSTEVDFDNIGFVTILKRKAIGE